MLENENKQLKSELAEANAIINEQADALVELAEIIVGEE
uniref:Uncharacterized protein n=1 Tax=uncultured bacterium Contig643 TaxID=1393602 RepID=W0FM43_9BACT|nr:hypothetical protein [uncultured bacterium Contig643]